MATPGDSGGLFPALTPPQRYQFEVLGYCLIPELLDATETAALLAELHELRSTLIGEADAQEAAVGGLEATARRGDEARRYPSPEPGGAVLGARAAERAVGRGDGRPPESLAARRFYHRLRCPPEAGRDGQRAARRGGAAHAGGRHHQPSTGAWCRGIRPRLAPWRRRPVRGAHLARIGADARELHQGLDQPHAARTRGRRHSGEPDPHHPAPPALLPALSVLPAQAPAAPCSSC